jgi:hypothetical protein
LRKNQLGNIAFGYLANTKLNPDLRGHDATIAAAYNGVSGYAKPAGLYDPEHPWAKDNWKKPGGGTYAGTWRTDNLAAFSIGKALAAGGAVTKDTLKAAMGSTGSYQGISRGGEIGPTSLTWIPEYGGFDTSTCCPCGKSRAAHPGSASSMESAGWLRGEFNDSGSKKNFDDWLSQTHENYWNPAISHDIK